MKKHIPNIITLGNLLCGCLAILSIASQDLVLASYFVGIALICDFFDGFAARLLKVSSPIGKDLDSLADMVTFGVVPGLVVFQLINFSINFSELSHDSFGSLWTQFDNTHPLSYTAFIIPILSAVRLAKFNNDTRQTTSFIGLPTPANAIVICSLPLVKHFNPEFYPAFLENPYVLCLLSVILSLLLVAEIPLFALKFKNFSWGDNKIKYIFLILCLVMLVALKFTAIPLIVLLYILLSIVNNIFSNKKV